MAYFFKIFVSFANRKKTKAEDFKILGLRFLGPVKRGLYQEAKIFARLGRRLLLEQGT
jgi:hypothetical protein